MPEVDPTLHQVIQIIQKLTPLERAEVLKRLQSEANRAPQPDDRAARLRDIRHRLSVIPGSLADDVIADREDRV